MTLHVYCATRDGIVTEDLGTVHVRVGENIDPGGLSMVFPPCLCPRCRDRNAPERGA